MTTYTTSLRIPKADFSQEPWHADVWAALDQVDSLIYNALVASSIAAWANSTVYGVGQSAVDTSNGAIYTCSVSHTSAASPTTFATDRTNNPTYWTKLVAGINVRGSWTQNTAYNIYDSVYQTSEGIAAICTVAHTSNVGGTIRNDSTKWAFIIDYTTIATAAATTFSPTGNVAATNVQNAIAELDTEKLAIGVALGTNADFDNATSSGFFWTVDAASTNTPSALNGGDAWFFLAVERKDANDIKQFAFGMNTGVSFTRLKDSGTWQSWKKLLSNSDVTTAANIRSNTGTGVVPVDQAWGAVEWVNLGNLTGAVTINCANGLKQYGTLTGNVTVSISNLKNGQVVDFAFKQDATGSRTISWSGVSFVNSVAPNVLATANQWALFGSITSLPSSEILVTGAHK